jgi:DNA-binding MarR family transcriptional regulator
VSEVRRASHRLARVARQIHEEDVLTVGERAVLMELSVAGPRTISDMARTRPVSRHKIQVLVNRLVQRSLVRLGENPRRQRSTLASLAPSGKALVRRLLDREARVLDCLAQELTAADVKRAVEVLARLSLALEGQDVERHTSAGSLAIVEPDMRTDSQMPGG